MLTLKQNSFLFLILFCLILSFTTTIYAKNAPWVGNNLSNVRCTGKGQGFGPFDYLKRSSLHSKLSIVESHHFTYQVESLRRGQSTTLVVGDIDYTLRAWPNHHRALNAITRYKLLHPRKPKPRSPVECYFQRAINFSPADATTRMLYGMYLQKTHHIKMADKQYKKALELSPQNPIICYNYGLFLFGQKKYSQAQQQAIIAYEAKFPLNGLKNKLKRVKFWPPKKTPKSVESSVSKTPKTNKTNKTNKTK